MAQQIIFQVTSDPNTFLFPDWTQDLGAVATALVTAEILEIDPDGETFGPLAGQLAALPCGLNTGDFEMQRNGNPLVTPWVPLAFKAWDAAIVNQNNAFDAVGQYRAMVTQCPQRIRSTLANIFSICTDGGNGPTYSGPNHPTVTVSYVIEYV
jgi:hypothetical protein